MKTASLLIVDDDQLIRNLLAEYFEGLGYTVVTAEGGEEALQKLKTFNIDCIVSDLVMPSGMTGLELLKRMRAEKINIPFLMNTGYPSIDTAVEAMREGAYDYITKPMHLDDMRIKVERALHAKKLEKSAKKVSIIMWTILISIPLWIALGVLIGKIWK
jgi:two-component system response regulator PilR (NtrC family)